MMKKIVIIEDMPLYIVPLRDALEGVGYEVSCVWQFGGGLDSCIQEIVEHSPDIILLDHELGAEFTGEEIAKHFSECRIISISSDTRKYCDEQFTGKAHLPRCSKELIDIINKA